MTSFWIIAALMILGSLLVMALPLLRSSSTRLDNNREQNIAIAQERLSELEAQLSSGTIDDQTFEQEKIELEKNLLDDITDTKSPNGSGSIGHGRMGLAIVGITVPLIAVGLYMYLGSPQYIEVSPQTADLRNPHAQLASEEAPSAEELTAMLEQRIRDNPEDPDAWFMLGRMYASAGRYADAETAYRTLAKITDNHPTALVVLADVMAMSQGGKIAGAPMQLVLQALESDPDNATALWLAGRGAMESSDYVTALGYYERAALQLGDNPELLQQLDEQIQEVRAAAQAAGVDVPAATIPDAVPTVQMALSITVDPALQATVGPTDTLFVFAREVDGPPMPLAAVKGSAGELPATVILDDGDLLRQGQKLSQYAELSITARITKSGQPMAASGDLQSSSITVRPGYDASAVLVIDQQVP